MALKSALLREQLFIAVGPRWKLIQIMSSILLLLSKLELLESLEQLFFRAGYKVSTFDQPNVMLEKLKEESPNCFLIEAQETKSKTLSLLHDIQKKKPSTPIIILGSNGNMANAVGVIRAGAKDYIEMPIIDRLLIESVQNAISA
ncbi:MAG: two-component system response regulator GlrR [Pseudohongiellaceae bacterium]